MKPQPKGIKRIRKTKKAEVSFVDESNSDLPDFALHQLLQYMTSRPNIATILLINPCYSDYENEFYKFLELIERLEEPGKSQLSAAIFPVFVHFYLNMIDEIDDADRFYRKFARIFHSAEGYNDVLKELYKIKSRGKIEEHDYFRMYRETKYILRIYPSVLEKLSSFLDDIKGKALWQTFCLFFYFENPDIETCMMKEKYKKMSKKVKSKYSKSKSAAKAAGSATEESAASSANEKPVTSSANKEPVTSSAAEEPVASSATEEPVASSATEEPVTSSAAKEPVASSATEEPVTSSAAKEPVASSVTEEPVVSFTATEAGGTDTEEPMECSTVQEPAAENSMQIQGNEDYPDDLITPPILETVFEWLDSNVLAVDVNHNASELCVTFEEEYILVIPLKKGNSSHKDVCESDPLFSNKFANNDHGSGDEIGVDLTEREKFYSQWSSLFINNWKEILKEVPKPIRIPFPALVRAVKYFPNNPHLLLAAYGLKLALVDTTSMTRTSFNNGHLTEVWDIDINSSGSYFCTAGYDLACCLWSNDDKLSPLRTYKGHKHIVTTVKFHPNGYYFFSGSHDCTVRLWNIESDLCLRSLVDHKSAVTSLACSPDKQILASADVSGIVKLWDVEQNNRICDLQCYMNGTYDGSKITGMSFPKEQFLALCSSKGVVRIWDVRKLDSVYSMYNKVHPGHIPVFLKTSDYGALNIVLQKEKT